MPQPLSAAGMGVLFDPPAVGVFKEVGGGADGGVDVPGEKIRGGLLVFVVVAGGQGQGEYDDSGFDSHVECDWLL